MTPPNMVMRLGLTGGIGSGKSTAAQALEKAGAVLIDADQISRQLTASGGAAIAAIEGQFGHGFIQTDGAMNRDAMRELIFNDPNAKQRLENILHPLIYTQTEQCAAQAAKDGATCLVFDLPLLVESGRWRQRLDHILVIDCDPTVQLSRVMQRSQLTEAQVRTIMAQQAPRLERLRAADTVINNTFTSIAQLQRLVGNLLHRLLNSMPDQISRDRAVSDMIAA